MRSQESQTMSRPVTSVRYQSRRAVIEQMAPRYREASLAQKVLLLNTVVARTGYARKYAIRLLNEVPEGPHTIRRRRSPHYGSEVQQALVAAWKGTRYICAKRLVPFLPTFVAALERHGHLQLTEESRSQLLAMSIPTAERVLRRQRKPAPRGLATTKAGSLLKQQIPIRTFQDWNEAQPGFLEADLVAHGGGDVEGSFLYTLTLTDIATGWTECLPLLYKSQEAVLSALQQARQLFPFPILGVDSDNGGEFINRTLLVYCEAEQITFTRGRPACKADQCHVEQKNGAIVRKFVGFDRLMGEQAYRQLRELYRAVRLHVNCFQPSMKLLTKHDDGEKVRRIYDPAKTPLQRLLLSGMLPTVAQEHLREVFQALDPLHLLQQVEQLQQAVWRCAAPTSLLMGGAPSVFIQPFCVERCLQGSPACQERRATSTSGTPTLPSEPSSLVSLLDWPRTSRDPFAGVWELILSLVMTHPEWGGKELFRELQRRFPGQYRPSHQSTLQVGLRKIHARLLSIMEEPWPQEVIQANVLIPITARVDQQERALSTEVGCAPTLPASAVHAGAGEERQQPITKEKNKHPQKPTSMSAPQLSEERSLPEQPVQERRFPMTIEGGIQAYVQAQEARGRKSKTLEWHRTALQLFQQYLVNERHLRFVSQVTEREVRGWMAFLRSTPSSTGASRSETTIGTYARSARACCHWLVHTGALERSPFVKGMVPKSEKEAIHVLETEEFERLLLACRAGGDSDPSEEWATVRNRAILWVLLDTGMRLSELRKLRLGDVDRERRALRVQDKRGTTCWLTLSTNGWYQLLSYLERHRFAGGCSEEGRSEQANLFLSEWYQPLTKNAITLLFVRLRKRAGMSDQNVTPTALRDTFAVRYLRAGGKLENLCEVLGLTDVAALKRYERLSVQGHKAEPLPTESTEELPSRQEHARQSHKRRRRRPSWRMTSNQQQPGAGGPDGPAEQARIRGSGEDP
jgi:site-specific recombinase XerD